MRPQNYLESRTMQIIERKVLGSVSWSLFMQSLRRSSREVNRLLTGLADNEELRIRRINNTVFGEINADDMVIIDS
jgi:hypothetical protein